MPRILVVDDDESTRTTLALVFGEKGYLTETAGTGGEALGKARERFFSLAFLDIKLPDMSGLDVLARLREAHPDMVVVVATAYASLETAVRALHEGASAYVTKPLRMDEVLVTIRQVLEKQRLAIENRQLFEVVQRELAERKRWETEIEAARAYLQTLQENSPDSIIATDAKGRITVFNPGAEELLGYRAAEVIGQPVEQVYPSREAARAVMRAMRADPRDCVRNLETLLRHKDGREIPVLISAAILRDADGQEQGTVGYSKDLTERKQAEEEIRRLATQLKAIARPARQMSVLLDLDELTQRVVQSLQEVTGCYNANLFLLEGDELVLAAGRGGYVTDSPPLGYRMSVGQGIIGDVAQSGRPLLVPDVSQEPRYFHWESLPETRSELAVPVRHGDHVLGVMDMQHVEPEAFDAADLEALGVLADQLGVALQNARLFEETRRRAAHLEALNAIIAAAAGAFDLPGLLETALDHTLRALGLEMGAVWLTDKPGTPARVQVLRGFPPEFEPEMGRAMAQAAPPIWWSISRPQPVADWRSEMQHGAQSTLAPVMARFGIRATLVVPIIHEGRHLGGLSVADPSPHEWSRDELVLAEAVGRQIGAAVERARLYEVEHSRRELLDTLYHLSKQLIATDELGRVLDIVARHAGEAVHVTFCRVVMLEQDAFVCRAAHPARVLNRDLGVGRPEPPPAWSHYRAVLGEREALLLKRDDPILSAAERQALLLDVAQTLCLCPLRAGDEEIGVLALGDERGQAREPFDDDKLRLARAIADIAASAIRRAMLHEQTEQRLERLDALRTIDTTITASLDLEVILNVLLDQVTERLNVDAADVLLFDPNTLGLEFVAGHGVDAPANRRTDLRLREHLAGQAVLERRIISISDFRFQTCPDPGIADLESEWPGMSSLQSAISNLKSDGFVAYHAAPLISKGEVRGVLELFHRELVYPDPEWLHFVESVAAQAAIAIDNLNLFRGLQRSTSELMLAYDNTLAGWARALELRDAETEGHSQRVTEMTLNLAGAMGLSDEELVHVRRGALLHDIGKMGIPDSILTRPGELDDAEWDIVRLHPIHAFEMLSSIPFLRPALDIPCYHHERWDGTGYPHRLKGEQIPLPARIFAVVDVYDALSTDRPYRQAWPREKVLAHIREQAGKHFDPEVVKAFFALLEEE